jgi:hypothetical protein
MTVLVTLSWAEIFLAAEVAKMRAIKNLQSRLADRYGDTERMGFDFHFLGCLGEIALAKHAGRYWSGNVGNFRAADVGAYQVRACGERHHCMILHHEDDDGHPFVNALALRELLPAVQLRGWLFGHEGKQPGFWRECKRPAFFVPAEQLHDMQELAL